MRYHSFPFPSNGKAYPKQSRLTPRTCYGCIVSIPFKRESVSKGRQNQGLRWWNIVSIPFKRESISKVRTLSKRCMHVWKVSIPFKRESISKVHSSPREQSRKRRFNSLQTGKHIQSFEEYPQGISTQVSIPFKRESISKAEFNAAEVEHAIEWFPFPSNGKAYPKRSENHEAWRKHGTVSIPFKRESISKEIGDKEWIANRSKSFNSLQTGKHIQRRSMWPPRRRSVGFNSLQTGKPIQSGAKICLSKSRQVSFNSLQTGKHIQRGYWRYKRYTRGAVSIPFKRESISKDLTVVDSQGHTWEMFPFPSNGKAYPKRMAEYSPRPRQPVSIPFKRESISKEFGKHAIDKRNELFPFPSNGKAYPKSL